MSKAKKTESAAKSAGSSSSEAKAIAKKLGVSLLFSNSKGEYFTDLNRALLSDKKENVKEHRFSHEEETVVSEPVMVKKVLTADDFKTTPELKEKGFKVGDDIEVPAE